MHEYSLMERVIQTVLADLKSQKIQESEMVKEVSLEVGALELHSEDSFRQAFESLAKGTRLGLAKLNLKVIPARIECIRCGHKGPCEDEKVDHHDPMPCAACPSCGALTLLSGGRGVGKISLTIDTASEEAGVQPPISRPSY